MANVKMNNKSLLEKLQAEITLKIGKKMSQQDILDKSIEYVYNNLESFITSEVDTPKLTKEKLERILKNAYKGPLYDMDKSDDEILYGIKRDY